MRYFFMPHSGGAFYQNIQNIKPYKPVEAMKKNFLKKPPVSFVQVSVHALRDNTISFAAKGILAVLYSLPDNWELSIEGLSALCKDGRTKVSTAFNELLKSGYITREQSKGEDGRFGHILYQLHEHPIDVEARTLPDKRQRYEIPLAENPLTEKPDAEIPCAENPQQYYNERILDSKNEGINPSTKKEKKVFSDASWYFRRRWREIRKECDGTQTAQFEVLTEKRAKMIDSICDTYRSQKDGKIVWSVIEKGIRYAMQSDRAQGKQKGMPSKCDINYMLENFDKLVEMTF